MHDNKISENLPPEKLGEKLGEKTGLKEQILDALRGFEFSAEECSTWLAELKQTTLLPDQAAAAACRAQWQDLCKPLYSLGRLEELICRLAGASGQKNPEISPRAAYIFVADNGIVEEGVSQTGQEVTAQVLRNINERKCTVKLWSERYGLDLIPVDLGARYYRGEEEPGAAEVFVHKIMPEGTHSFLRQDAMSREQALEALAVGRECARAAARAGVRLLVGGEMGIGNTSSSTALIAALLGCPPEEICGRGSGLSDEAFRHKSKVLGQALATRKLGPEDPLEALAAVGGLDIAALCGLYLGAAEARVPVLLDGLISYAAALCAFYLVPASQAFLIPTHVAREKGAAAVAKALNLKAVLDLDIALGEGSGAILLIPLLEAALQDLNELPRFAEGHVEAYEDFAAKNAQEQ